ncbi:VCBS domain-containing protein [Mycobacterium sp. EPa45]|uniref:Ig-like domain-containing protein n=1 Tax=Mycobacterium sp. EPa45 TaxID=1545728 RepID=UPI00130DC3AE|nr:VCBS domain-containing protein [Mycobacterium sp. EPa45]
MAAAGELSTPAGVPADPTPTSLFESVLGWVRRTFNNATPTLSPQIVTVTAEPGHTSAPISFTGGADADGDALTYAVTQSGAGTLIPTGDAFTYTPDAAWDGRSDYTDTFTITASDAGNGFHIHGLPGLLHLVSFGLLGSAGDTATSSVTVQVLAAQVDPPVLTDPAHPYTPIAAQPGDPAGSVRGQITVTDIHQPITYSYSGPTTTADGSTLSLNADGSFLYTPSDSARHDAAADTAHQTGADAFAFTVTATNSRGAASDIAITVPVAAANGDPTPPAVAPTATVDHTTGAVTNALGYTDPDGDTLRFSNPNGGTATTWATAHGGTVTVDPTTGRYTYTPDPLGRLNAYSHPDQNADTFDVTITDGYGSTTTHAITVTIDPAAAVLTGATQFELISAGSYSYGSPVRGPDGSVYATTYDQAAQKFGITVVRPDGTRAAVDLDGNPFASSGFRGIQAGPGGRAYLTTDHDVLVVNPDNTFTTVPLAGRATGRIMVTADGHAYQLAADPGSYGVANKFSVTVINPDGTYATVPLTNNPPYGGVGDQISLSEEAVVVADDGTLYVKTYAGAVVVEMVHPDASHMTVTLPRFFGQNCSCSGITVGPDGRAYVLGNLGADATLITVSKDGTYTTTPVRVPGLAAYGNSTADSDGSVYLAEGTGFFGNDTMVIVHPDQSITAVPLPGSTLFEREPIVLPGGRVYQDLEHRAAVIVNPDGTTVDVPDSDGVSRTVVVGADGRTYVFGGGFSASLDSGVLVVGQDNSFTTVPAPGRVVSVVVDEAGYAYITSGDVGSSTTVTVVRPDGTYSALTMAGPQVGPVLVSNDGVVSQAVSSADGSTVTTHQIAVARA